MGTNLLPALFFVVVVPLYAIYRYLASYTYCISCATHFELHMPVDGKEGLSANLSPFLPVVLSVRLSYPVLSA